MGDDPLIKEAREIYEHWLQGVERYEAIPSSAVVAFLKRLCEMANVVYVEDMTFFQIWEDCLFLTTDAWKTSVLFYQKSP